MVVRHTGIFLHKFVPVWGAGIGINMISYKCSQCAHVIRFYVPDEMEYLKKIYDMRGGTWYIPSVEEWSEEDEEVGRQLQALGYFGGR